MEDVHPSIPGVDVDHRRVDGAGAELHVAVAGPEDGDPVVLLHGFPDFWYGWRHQIPRLVEEGYRVWVPDQRGYNTSEKPAGVDAYDLDTLCEDLLAIIDRTKGQEIPVVGHDWGATVGWWAATEYPERVDRYVAINVPHPTVFRQFLTRDPRQILRSWYGLFFQLSWLSEKAFEARNYRFAVAATRDAAREGAFTDEDMEHYREAWSQPGAVGAMLNWYRAFLQAYPGDPPDSHVAPPTALFWGTRDPALREAMAKPSVDLCEDGRLVRFEGATHWVHREVPEMLNGLLVDFLEGRELE